MSEQGLVEAHQFGHRVRRLESPEAAAFPALRLEALASDPTAFAMAHEEECDQPLSEFESRSRRLTVFGGYFQGDLAGITTITRLPLLKRQHVAMLWGMHVQERYRGSGLAASILEVAITHGEASFDQLELYVAVGNDHVATFMRELGDGPASRDALGLANKGPDMRI